MDLYDSIYCRRLYFEYHNLVQEDYIKCKICGKSFPKDEMEIHHLIPRHIEPKLTYELWNLVLICKKDHHKCHNIIKKNKAHIVIDEIRKENQLLAEEIGYMTSLIKAENPHSWEIVLERRLYQIMCYLKNNFPKDVSIPKQWETFKWTKNGILI